MVVALLNLLWNETLSLSLTWLLEEGIVVIVIAHEHINILKHRHVYLLLDAKQLFWMELKFQINHF